jgi:drug/metabolite transporter (DMT)-like permease
MTPPQDPAGRLAVIAGIGAALASFCAGTALVAIRSLAGEADALTITAWRVTMGVVLMIPFALWLERGWPRGRDIVVLAALGVLMFGVGQWLVSAALQYTTAARGGIVASMTPFLALAMSSLAGVERFTWLKTAGVACATAGVAMALWQDASAVPGGWRGDLLMLAAATSVAAFSVTSARVARRFTPLIFVVSTMLPGTAFLLAVAAVSGANVTRLDYDAAAWTAIAYIGIAGSLVVYGVTLWALRHTTPTRVAITITLNPVGAILGAAVVLGEPLTAGLFAGLSAIALGLVLANLRSGRAAEQGTS